MDRKSLPIGVFDSGVGGLTVLDSLQKLMPHESYLYLGDTARLPYGCKSADTVIKYAIQAGDFLVERGVKYLVLACNTVSAHALPVLAERYKPIPVIGVVEPGAIAAVNRSPSEYIAVLATESTVASQAYTKAILALNKQAQVIQQSCSLLVALAEEGEIEGVIAEAVIAKYLAPLFKRETVPDCVVLGCTHFPVMLTSIKKIVAGRMVIVDSAQTTALTVMNQIAELGLANASGHFPTMHYYVTDAPKRFAKFAHQFTQQELDDSHIELVELVDPEFFLPKNVVNYV